MSRLKDQMIEEQEKFWSSANTIISDSENCNEFVARCVKKAPNFMLNAPSSKKELQEHLEELWENYWSKYN
jgi:hypothetical protein